jgi:uncharacterized protein YjiS (DUF1127 family)
MSSLIDAYALTLLHRSRRIPANDNRAMIAFANEGLDLSFSATVYKVIDGLGGLVAKGLGKIRSGRARRLAIRELDRLSNHLLADIGLHRGEIVSVVDEVIAGGTPRRSERVVRIAPKSTGGPATVNDNVTDIAA